jgi:hypothetical protein
MRIDIKNVIKNNKIFLYLLKVLNNKNDIANKLTMLNILDNPVILGVG